MSTLREPPVKEEKARRTPAEKEPPFLPGPPASPAGMHCAAFCTTIAMHRFERDIRIRDG
jgi:hypothetical protein